MPARIQQLREALQRSAAIAAVTFQEALRMRLFLLLGLVALASLLGGFVFREFDLGSSELVFIADFGFGGMTLFGSVVAIVVTTQLLYGEIEQKTIMTLLSKPVTRAEFLIGKLAGSWLTLCCFVATLCLSLLLALWIRETQLMERFPEEFPEGRVVSYMNVAVFAMLQTLRLAILSSATALFVSYASSGLFAIFMGFFFWMIAQLQTVATARAGGDTPWLVEGLLKLVSLAVPDLRLFDIGNQLLGAAALDGGAVARLAVYAALYVALYALFATLILSRREL